ncbi:carboxypeptidase-like regulatory domain-containing protein [Zeaxanthinibacter sp. PT1]|uniref:carboxypeptidase-like regulatory domain-containing protein n=1 Tax=Zeaxanthinibacter TaxID=561554 RepID=UPI00234AA0AF|nr:carboxypeptidase-like regulatory domain-containing protein [Zeaxanthinibacter sp. PT1]MDC6352199.1 carboxypeptidase-like regulatory domain-containing protein [Zeaxanthinibacter sp. PT1]
MKSLYLTLLFLAVMPLVYAVEEDRIIKGRVTDGSAALPGAEVQVENSDRLAVTDEQGYYQIRAAVGDILTFSYTGFETRRIYVEDVTRIVNVDLLVEYKELGGITITGSQRKKSKNTKDDYYYDKEMLWTAFGYKDQRAFSGNVRFLYDDQMTSAALCVLDILRNQFPGVSIRGNCSSGGSVQIRGGSSISNDTPAIFDVDGQVFTDTPVWINPNNIKRIAVLNNLNMTIPYGAAGNGGVIVINTNVSGVTPGMLERPDPMRFNRQLYDEEQVLTQDALLNNAPEYLKALYQSNSFDEARSTLEAYREVYKSYPYFYLDAMDYFLSNWKNKQFATDLMAENSGIFDGNPVLLKAAAYLYEKHGLSAEANVLYKKIYSLRTRYPQSYLDLAHSYHSTGETARAASLLLRLGSLSHQGLIRTDTVEFNQFYERELLAFYEVNDKISLGPGLKKRLREENESYLGAKRIVLEWNDSEAEFEVQFVNPNKQVYEWVHSATADRDLILNEQLYGWSSKDFFLDDTLNGNWLINVRYLGNRAGTQSYLKATFYNDYGLPSQSQREYVLTLRVKGAGQQLAQFGN